MLRILLFYINKIRMMFRSIFVLFSIICCCCYANRCNDPPSCPIRSNDNCCKDCADWDFGLFNNWERIFTEYGDRLNVTCILNEKGKRMNFSGYDMNVAYDWDLRPFTDVIKTYNQTSMTASILITPGLDKSAELSCRIGNEMVATSYLDVEYPPNAPTNLSCVIRGSILNCTWNMQNLWWGF